MTAPPLALWRKLLLFLITGEDPEMNKHLWLTQDHGVRGRVRARLQAGDSMSMDVPRSVEVPTKMVDSSGSHARITWPRAKSQGQFPSSFLQVSFFCTYPLPTPTMHRKMKKRSTAKRGYRSPWSSGPCLCPRQQMFQEKYRHYQDGTALLFLLENLLLIDYFHWARHFAHIISFYPHYKAVW